MTLIAVNRSELSVVRTWRGQSSAARSGVLDASIRRAGLLRCLGMLAALGGLAAPLSSGYVFAAALKPNIVVILADDMGWTGTSVQMDPEIPESRSDFYQTPNLEELAARGMRFSSAYAAPMCAPSRAAIQTGKSPAQLQMTDLPYPSDKFQKFYAGQPLVPPLVYESLPAEEATIAEWLDQNNAGYVTGHFGKWHLSPIGPGNTRATQPIYGYDFEGPGPAYVGEDPKSVFRYANRAMSFMADRVAANEPFFMQISSTAPHAPFEARAETLSKYQNLPPGERHTDPLYAAMTEDFDASIGMVLQKIADLGIQDNTYIVFASDNGGIALLGADENSPLHHAKGAVYEGGLRVPMIVAGPGIEAGSVSRVPVTLQDLFATTSALAGITAPLDDDLESANLAPIWHNGGVLPGGVESLARGHAPGGELFFHMPHYYATTEDGPRAPASAVRDGDYKLVKIYGEGGQADTIMLFNLAADVRESSDPNSSLNLATSMPAKTSELLSKLDGWLEAIDASMPYDITDHFALRWDAAQPGTDNAGWRTTNDVGSRFRERWEQGGGDMQPSLTPIVPYQPGLARQAFRFDGDDSMSHEFFRASNGEGPRGNDLDRSASVESWFRVDETASSQVLFESGDSAAGMSLTLGEGTLRFRVLGRAGNSLTTTAPIDQFANPMLDFIHAAAVFNDDSADRYVEIYINGSLAARTNGNIGDGQSLYWDSVQTDWEDYRQAGLGMPVGVGSTTDLGGNGGSGPLPFSGGGFRGDIAELAFYNHALNADLIAANYNAKLDPSDFGVIATSGDVYAPASRPTSVARGAAEAWTPVIVEERHSQLTAPLRLDAYISGAESIASAYDAYPATLPQGAQFTSYLLHFDPVGDALTNNQPSAGSIEFSESIVGLLFKSDSLVRTDALVGSIGDYGDEADRGWKLGAGDMFTFSADRRVLHFNIIGVAEELLQLRVITQQNPTQLITGFSLFDWESTFGQAKPDADGDDDVDGADFLAWQRRVGTSVGQTDGYDTADVNSDGFIDGYDLATWMTAFGKTAGFDLDEDGDSDGADFLAWQRRVTMHDAGDFNRDGRIDGGDLVIWKAGAGLASSADFDDDGYIDGTDFLAWQRRVGSMAARNAARVPEPSAMQLALLLGFTLATKRISFYFSRFQSSRNATAAPGRPTARHRVARVLGRVVSHRLPPCRGRR